MKKTSWSILGVLLGVLAICGCYSPRVAEYDYPTVSFAEVALKDRAKVRIVALDEGAGVWHGDTLAQKVVEKLKESFADAKNIQLVEEKADYWMIVSALSAQRIDRRADLPYMETMKIVKEGAKSDEPGMVREKIVQKRQASKSLAEGVSIAIYEVKGLSPIYYVEIPVYDGFIQASGEKPVRPASARKEEFAQQIVGRVKDILVTQTKRIKVLVPEEASLSMKEAFLAEDQRTAIAEASSNMLPLPFDEFLADVHKGDYEDRDGDLATMLSNYYIQAIGLEIGCLDPAVLEELHKRQTYILELAKTDSLAMICPIALARLEYKLANLEK